MPEVQERFDDRGVRDEPHVTAAIEMARDALSRPGRDAESRRATAAECVRVLNEALSRGRKT